MDIKVRRQDGRTWIDGLKGWTMREMADDIHAARYTVLQAIGSEVRYEDLLGVSGMAFRLQVAEDLCPSSANSFCGFRCCVRSLQLLPWSIRLLELNREQTDAFRQACAAVIESIDRGIPVHYGNCIDGVIIGYVNDGHQWVCLHPMEGRKEPFLKAELPGTLVLPGKPRAEPPDQRQLALEALRQAVDMAGTETVEQYAVGFHAWQIWLKKLTELREHISSIGPEIMWGNAWIYFSLIESRRTAAAYLHSIAGTFENRISRHLQTAAGFYEQLVDALLSGDGDSQHVAPFPGPPAEGLNWTPEQMQEQAVRLKAAFEWEQKAIAKIQAALAEA